MRFGVLSDIHGNLPALQASLADLRALGVDAWICVGDIVGYGPQPNECIETIAALDALCVAGNHELLALGSLTTERSGALCRETVNWTRDVLSDDSRAFISRLPRLIVDGELVIAHGSLADPQQYVRTPADSAEQLRRLGAEHGPASILILGHTHVQAVYSEAADSCISPHGAVRAGLGDRLLLNPGAVGQSRQREARPMARYLLVDTDRREMLFRNTAYDVRTARRALRSHGLPRECIHIPPGLLPKISRRSRRILRTAATKRRTPT